VHGIKRRSPSFKRYNLMKSIISEKLIKHLDCTLRDGGYYNAWDFSPALIIDYLDAMAALRVDFIEIGFRSLKNTGFKGGCAFSTDAFINSLNIPNELSDKIGVMINGSELVQKQLDLVDLEQQAVYVKSVLQRLFVPKLQSPVSLVRIACHIHEFIDCLPAATWLKEQGYLVGFNLMQVADRSYDEITELAEKANQYPIDALYFADSMGSLSPQQTSQIVKAFQKGCSGALGIHTHDNMGQAITNTMQAIEEGVTWVDSTVTGMGRGPGNAQTEYLTIEIENLRLNKGNPTKLFELIRNHFKPMQEHYGWGTNPYYYLAAKYGIHSSYIQEMMQDARYNDEDILSVIQHLKVEGGKKFSLNTLEFARHFYSGEARGSWSPAKAIQGRDVLIVGTGPGVKAHCTAIESYIQTHKPYVIALNTQQNIAQQLIDVRVACHPVRLLADCQEHLKLPQPLITPASMLPLNIQQELKSKELYDYGIAIDPKGFEFYSNYCTLPTSLVVAYALAIATSGQAQQILLAGFDGFSTGDPRNDEMIQLFKEYYANENALVVTSLTPSQYQIPSASIYGVTEYET
jgi:4-hydroxy 2-oxovalerate aldolase